MSNATMTVEGWAVEPRQNTTQTGKKVLSIRVAHSWSKKQEGGGYETIGGTTWAEATFWDQDAEYYARRVQKGTYVTISGDPEVQVYEGKNGAGATVVLRNPTIGIDDRRSKTGQQGGQQQSSQQGSQQPNDVWSAPGDGFNDETPF
jgi:single-strand DNA-binding protein